MGFEADWLALRAPADARARDQGLLAKARAAALSRPGALIVDLGCGSGASMRALDLPGGRWRLIDNDAALLRRAAQEASARGIEAETALLDLSSGQELGAALAGADLVVASAFLDLVSERWIAQLVEALPDAAALYVALSYSGQMRWSPAHALDPAIQDAFNRHQRGDKGFGLALGPEAANALAQRLEATGRAPEMARSDWRLSQEHDGALIAELTAGVAGAAVEMGLEVDDWRASRMRAVSGDVSHLDLFAPRLSARQC